MAYTPRSWQTIQAQMLQEKQMQSALSDLTSTSQAAYWILWTFIMALSISLLEQIFAIFENEIETIVADAAPGTPTWIQAQVMLFQYSATTPQYIQINPDFTFAYPIINAALRIISACAVVSNAGVTQVKVATGSPPGPINSSQTNALLAYLNTICPAGINLSVISVYFDILQINGTVYYNGQFNSVIQDTVIAALNNYMASLPFNGLVKLSDIEKTILAVPGVVDYVPTDVICSPGTSVPNVYGTPVSLVTLGDFVSRFYQTYSGYIQNAASPSDFASTLTFAVAQQ